MSAHLQRLLARTVPGSGIGSAPASVPAAPLSSPLADHDQRLGLPEFEAPVPSVFDEPQVVEPEQGPRGGARPSTEGKAVTKDAAKAPARLPPELRLVAEAQPPAMPEPSPADVVAISPTPTIHEAPLLVPSPLDIEPTDLEPVIPPLDDEAQPTARESTAVPLDPPEPAARQSSPLAETEGAFETESQPAPEGRDDQRASPAPRPEIEPAPRRSPLALPDVVDGLERPTPALLEATSPEPAPREQERRASQLAQERAVESRAAASVNIEQIIIDVHEPQAVTKADVQGRVGAPATAAAASIIGPLPVRRSTISLFGMRRR